MDKIRRAIWDYVVSTVYFPLVAEIYTAFVPGGEG